MGRLLFYILSLVSLSVGLQAQTILVRPKASTAMTYGGSSFDQTEKIEFTSPQNYQDFINHVSEDVDWEPLVPLSADDVSLPQTNTPPAVSDPLIGNQWSLTTANPSDASYGAVNIDAVRAWTVTKGSEEVVVYVMDSGIDVRDPDLRERVTSYYDAYNPGQQPRDENGHGTHVASILGARGENSYGISGVVPGNIQIADGRFLNAQNQGDSQMALRVLEWMEQDMRRRREQNPKVKFVSSNSWGGDVRSGFLEEAMQRLSAYDFLPITSAGNHGGNNDSKPYFPCNFRVIANTCVAASDQRDFKASFSGYGPASVHLLAPGDQIYGIVPGLQTASSYASQYDRKRGTSQAVPHVSGVAALIWAANPNLSAVEVRQVLVSSVDRLPGAENEVLSGGRLNAYRAVLMATGQDASKADRGLASTQNAGGGGGGCSLRAQDSAASGHFFSLILVVMLTALLAVYRKRSSSRV